MQQELLLLNIRGINYANLSCYMVQQGLKKTLVKPPGCQTGFLIQIVFRKT